MKIGVTTSPAPKPRKLLINREPGSNQLTIWGTIPLGDPGATEALAIEDPAEFAAKLMRDLLEKRGISGLRTGADATRGDCQACIRFTPRRWHRPEAEPMRSLHRRMPLRTVLADHQSMPLVQDLKVINKVSQNLHAELILRLLGRERGRGGTVEGGLEVMRNWLLLAGYPAG